MPISQPIARDFFISPRMRDSLKLFFEVTRPHPNPLQQGEREQAAALMKASPLPSAGEGQGEGECF